MPAPAPSSSNSSTSAPAAEHVHDCLIVGAGPAGLTAATYLARFHRDFVVVDAGKSRARWIPTSHNCPGFPFGVAGPDLLAKLRTQATQYGAAIVDGRIGKLEREGDAFTATADDGRRWRARHVLLATGVVDVMPAMEGLEAGIERHAVRLCAVCDGYEASDDRIAVVAPVDDAIRHALFLRTFSRRVTAIRSEAGEPSAECARLAAEAGIAVLPPALAMRCSAERCIVDTEAGSHEFDTLYPVLGCDPQAQLATMLGARVEGNGELQVDARMQTSVDGVYAIGDIVSGLNQISVAMGHAAIAATGVHNRLPRNWREAQG
ncbi:MAG: NAD(P)/FAD-dependent oxidoreductase [Lysobacteraceae bacterium]|nr:MAG: NAD(P)/FAD-dependent oxidoreductase [Xanthomonadaceae bacterium]